MLSWALTFFVFALLAALFGFTGIAAAAAGIAKILFFVFLVAFVIALLVGRGARGGAGLWAMALLVPALAGCTVSGTQPETMETNGVWLKVFDDEDLDLTDDWKTMHGPDEIADLHVWDNEIESLKVGPKARVFVYDDEDFKGRVLEFGPSTVINDLDDHDFGNEIESIRIVYES